MHDKLAGFFRQHQFDAIVGISPVNVLYLTGANILRLSQRLIPERLAMVLWPAEGEPCVITMLQQALVLSQSRVKDIRSYVEFRDLPIKILAEVIRERGLERSRIGIEKRYLAAEYYEQLQQFLPEASFQGCDRQLDLLRAIKTPEEIQLLRQAAVATDNAIAEAYLAAKVGCEEAEVATNMRDAMFAGGADEVNLLWLGAGEHSTEVHHKACSKRLQKGDVIRVDIGGTFRGYYSDLARTAVVGKPTAAQAEAYKIVWDVMEEVISTIRPGIPAKRLFEIYRDRFQKRGLAVPIPHVGHSLGIKLHEEPILMQYEDETLKPNMVLEVELVHIANGALYHNEDQIVVTGSGYEIVSRTRDWSQVLSIV